MHDNSHDHMYGVYKGVLSYTKCAGEVGSKVTSIGSLNPCNKVINSVLRES